MNIHAMKAFLHSIFLIFNGFWKTYNTVTDLQDIDNVDFDFFSCSGLEMAVVLADLYLSKCLFGFI